MLLAGIGRVSGVLWDSFCFSTILNVSMDKTVFLCTVPGALVSWGWGHNAMYHFAWLWVKKSTGRSGSTEETREWGSTSFHQSDRMALRCSLQGRLGCSLLFRSLDSTDLALGVNKGHPPGKCFTDGPHAESFQLCNRRAGGWGLLLGNTTHLGDGFALVHLLSVAVFSDLCCYVFWLNSGLLQ